MPDDNPPEDPVFYLGLTMAGAVSAGAYTAGVLDVLMRAIDAHNARVRRAEPDGPRHRIVLKTMSGASAGGVSAGLTVASLIDAQVTATDEDVGMLKAPDPIVSTGGQTYHVALKTLHDVWVRLVDLWHPQGTGLLSLSDLVDPPGEDAPQLRALLNGQHLDDAASDALDNVVWGPSAADDEREPGKPYDFVAQNLDIFLTTTNLGGVPYRVSFGQGGAHHLMFQHSTVRHFSVQGLGTDGWQSPWLQMWKDEGIPLPLPATGGTVPFVVGPETGPLKYWRAFTESAVASGAFPIGLPARAIAAEAHDFGMVSAGAAFARGGALPIDVDSDPNRRFAPPEPALGDVTPDQSLYYVAVDGGAANNEPFEFARFALRKATEAVAPGILVPLERNPRGAEEANRAVIMIDPFPDEREYKAIDKEGAIKGLSLAKAAAQLVPTLIDQARFKPSALIDAANEEVHSRFLIVPNRPLPDRLADASETPLEGDEPPRVTGQRVLASGAFGGFSGFFDESFRVHDFMLGQENARRFIERDFCLGSGHKDFFEGRPATGSAKRPIIEPPEEFFETATPELAPWPAIGRDRLTNILKQATLRAEKVGEAFLSINLEKGLAPWVLRQLWKWKTFVAGFELRLSLTVAETVMAELISRGLHGDHVDDDRDRRNLAVALVATGRRALTAGDLRAKLEADGGTGLDTEQIQSLLDEWSERGIAWRSRRFVSDPIYTYAPLKPGSRTWLFGKFTRGSRA